MKILDAGILQGEEPNKETKDLISGEISVSLGTSGIPSAGVVMFYYDLEQEEEFSKTHLMGYQEEAYCQLGTPSPSTIFGRDALTLKGLGGARTNIGAYSTQLTKEHLIKRISGKWGSGDSTVSKIVYTDFPDDLLNLRMDTLLQKTMTLYLDRALPRSAVIAKMEEALNHLSVPYSIDERVIPLLDRATLEAANIVITTLADKISSGLPVKHIMVEPLTDVDAGQWEEVVLTIHASLNSREANQEWDAILTTISEIADGPTDTEVAAALLERIGIHFTWVTSSDV